METKTYWVLLEYILWDRLVAVSRRLFVGTERMNERRDVGVIDSIMLASQSSSHRPLIAVNKSFPSVRGKSLVRKWKLRGGNFLLVDKTWMVSLNFSFSPFSWHDTFWLVENESWLYETGLSGYRREVEIYWTDPNQLQHRVRRALVAPLFRPKHLFIFFTFLVLKFTRWMYRQKLYL